ncbi:MAG TPA: DUF3866 domain-containing protein [Acidimicrobiaceae bacterium]|nr:DUF3866 domain-containing protein [Acidimicrobiaceae bacterium]
MPNFRSGQVAEILSERPGLQRLRIAMDDGQLDRAYCLTELIGQVAVGDHVVCNTTAVDLGLGTGGWHVVHWNHAQRSVTKPGPDHVMKLRYTSLQFDAGTSELVHQDLGEHLNARPVIAIQVHSQLGIVAPVIAALRPGTKVAYVMTDGASLPLALSDLVANLREADLLCGTVTSGHSFGGDLEAVSVPSGLLLAAEVLEAEIIVAGMGPGVVGTGTRYGNSAVEAAWILNCVATLGGEPVMCIRASNGDARGRHAGMSHHSSTALGLCPVEPWVATGPFAPTAGVRSIDVEVPPVERILQESGIPVTTMGRTYAQDTAFFESAAAAAAAAVHLLTHQSPTTPSVSPHRAPLARSTPAQDLESDTQ